MNFAKPAALARPWQFVFVLFAVWIARLAAIPVSDLAADDVPTARLIAEAWRVAIWLAVPLCWVAFVERLDPRAAIDQRPGTHMYLAWLAVLAATFAARFVEVLTGSVWIAIPPVSVPGFFVASVGLLFASLCEEFVFRGLVLKALRLRFAFWPANALAAALYALMLVPGWLALVEMGPATLAYLSVSVFLFGCLLGWFVRLSGTIWVAVAAHFLNDFLQGFGFPG
ncbi:MAG: CPBP family intramembrane metalloprotease [Proteobacteria bacterium]|nr:CPBP family intramembrane metalloprotease [Pseudomonadota bacterium]